MLTRIHVSMGALIMHKRRTSHLLVHTYSSSHKHTSLFMLITTPDDASLDVCVITRVHLGHICVVGSEVKVAAGERGVASPGGRWRANDSPSSEVLFPASPSPARSPVSRSLCTDIAGDDGALCTDTRVGRSGPPLTLDAPPKSNLRFRGRVGAGVLVTAVMRAGDDKGDPEVGDDSNEPPANEPPAG
jgi:hypothetical protein